MAVGEGARRDLEAIVPVAIAQALEAVTQDGQVAGFPLPQDVAVLMQHQPGIVEEVLRRAAQVDPSAPGRGDGAAV